MLPSVVSSASIEFDLYCRKTIPRGPIQEDTMKEAPIPSSITRDSQYERVGSSEGDDQGRDTAGIDTGSASLKNCLSLSDALPKRAATSVNKQSPHPFPAPFQRKPNHELSSKRLHGPHDTKYESECKQQRRAGQPPRINLGSLSSFMETRGKSTSIQVLAKSPYFARKDSRD
ncbi:hypothetical protein BDV10DRAFT_173179 [Aspergillus recurvatus]